MSRTAVDLSAIWKQLDPRGPYREIREGLRRFEAGSSVIWDLMEVQASLQALEQIANLDDKARRIHGRGLMMHAVITYARATHSGGEARAKVDVIRAYSEAQKEQHRHIIALRNSTFAHHGGGEGAFGEGWYVERTLLVFAQGERESLLHYRSGYLYSERVVDPLRELVDIAIPFVQAEVERRSAELKEPFFAECEKRGEFLDLIRRHIVDIAAVFPTAPPLDQWDLAKGMETWSFG